MELTELKKKYLEMGAEIERLEKEEQEIRVPDGIRFQELGDALAIEFGNNQKLWVRRDNKIWTVSSGVVHIHSTPCKLVKTTWGELKAGDWYTIETGSLDSIDEYCLKIDDKNLLCIEELLGVEYPRPYSNDNDNVDFYKVVPIKY